MVTDIEMITSKRIGLNIYERWETFLSRPRLSLPHGPLTTNNRQIKMTTTIKDATKDRHHCVSVMIMDGIASDCEEGEVVRFSRRIGSVVESFDGFRVLIAL
jgi:hypothetical protein